MTKLDGAHPELVARISRVLAAMRSLGFPMRVCQGVRTVSEQQALYAQGRTAPGKIVTNADGVIKRSNHQPKTDGFGHAVDCCFEGSDPFGDTQPWTAYGQCCKAVGLVWGGSWQAITDRPHAELAS